MKKQLSLMLCMFAFVSNVQSQTISPAPYCEARIASLTNIDDNHIKEVSIGTLSNISGSVYFNDSEYAYYNNLPATELKKGINIPAKITVSKNDLELDVCWIFIDYNLNNSFEDSELVGQVSTTELTNADFGELELSFNINIPSSASEGQTRMRIIYTSDMELEDPSVPIPCNANTDMSSPPVFIYGEIEDYNVTVKDEQATTSISSSSDFMHVSLYPNPGKTVFSVECETAMQLTVYNPAGEKILERNMEAGKQLLDLSAQKEGIYFIIIQHDDMQQTLKLIKD